MSAENLPIDTRPNAAISADDLRLMLAEVRNETRKTNETVGIVLAYAVESNRIVRAVRNTQRRLMGLAGLPRRSRECDRWCFERWTELSRRPDLIPFPATKEGAFEFLCRRKSFADYLKEHGITLPRHFSEAVDNGRKTPPIAAKTPWK